MGRAQVSKQGRLYLKSDFYIGLNDKFNISKVYLLSVKKNLLLFLYHN